MHTWKRHTSAHEPTQHNVNTPPYMNDDTANDCFVAHFLQCHLKVPHFQAYPILPPTIHSSHLLICFSHFRAAHSVLCAFLSSFSQCVHSCHHFSTKCVRTSDLAMTIFSLRKNLQFSSFIYYISFYLIPLLITN